MSNFIFLNLKSYKTSLSRLITSESLDLLREAVPKEESDPVDVFLGLVDHQAEDRSACTNLLLLRPFARLTMLLPSVVDDVLTRCIDHSDACELVSEELHLDACHLLAFV